MTFVAIEAPVPAAAAAAPASGTVLARHPVIDAIVEASLRAPALVQYDKQAWVPAAAWQPESTARIHNVETVVGLSIMAYFAYGAAAALGLV